MKSKEPLVLGKELPKTAPALWKERRARDFRNPAHFILHHYRSYLGERGKVLGMTQADIEPLDPGLYVAIRNWPRFNKNRQSADFLRLKDRMPTLFERNDEIIAAILEGRGVPGLTMQSLTALFQALQRRKKKTQLR